MLREMPASALAQNSAGRVTDIAIDHSELAHLTPQQIAATVAVMQAEGMNATVSSIHINGWFGTHTKLSGARWPGRESMGGVFDMGRMKAWATASLAWAKRQWPDQLASAVLHLDEQTPHLHLRAAREIDGGGVEAQPQGPV